MKRSILILLITTMVSSLTALCQKSITDSTLSAIDTLNNDFGLFTNDGILHLALRFDLRTYTSKKPTDEYLPAILTYFINDKDSINKEIKLKSRGIMRNGICDFPPIMLNLKNAGFKGGDMKKIEKIKLVTHCDYGNENYLFMEYLVYKLYNVLTDNSFRVRLAKIEYINTAKKGKSISTYCFLIEPLNILADRIGTVPVSSLNLSQMNIIPPIMDRMAIFNYMIGNTDWSVPNQHNCKVLTGRDFNYPGLGVIVPYDFDYAGIINTDYAVPFDGLGLKSVLERRYLGACRTKEEFIAALAEFKEKKSEFYRVIKEFPLLNEKIKKEMTKYLDSFYDDVENDDRVVKSFQAGCYKF
jgi:hypothetical protein